MYIIKYKKEHLFETSIAPSSNDDTEWYDAMGNKLNKKRICQAIQICLSNLASMFPSLYEVIRNVDVKLVNHAGLNTMATDGSSIMISPIFVDYIIKTFKSNSLLLIQYVLVHEIFHILYNHCYEERIRSSKYPDHTIANMAQDFQINYDIENLLVDNKGNKLYKGCTNALKGCYDDDYGMEGWEKLYDRVLNEKTPISTRLFQETSEEWKNGFLDGFLDALDELRKDNLIESCQI